MDNLLKIGIEQEIIDKILEKNGAIITSNLDYNYDNVYKIINVLSTFRITGIDNLLINHTPIFMVDYKDIINKLSKITSNETIREINSDPSMLYEILDIA